LHSLIRPRPLAAIAIALLVVGGASLYLSSAKAAPSKPTTRQVREAQTRASALKAVPTGSRAANLVLASKDSAQPDTMEQFLTAVTTDVDAYWTKVFQSSDLPEPRVGYNWIPAGQTAASACGDESGRLGDSAAAYCPRDDTISISQKFATDIYTGALDRALPGSSQGYGRTAGDFSVAYIVAHEYGHQVQDELGLFRTYDGQVPTMGFELQADCYAGTWANSAYRDNRLEDGDVQEALDAALAVGDFNAADPHHHGTPEQRAEAWRTGFDTGQPSACSRYLDPAGPS
jgi:predicted metalloprotease